MALVDARGMEADVLVVADVPQSPPTGDISDEELGVETPSDHGLRHGVVVAIRVHPLRNIEECLVPSPPTRGVAEPVEGSSFVIRE